MSENNNTSVANFDYKKLNSLVVEGLKSHTLEGFERAFSLASATEQLQGLLTTTYMKPIMKLQNTSLGFKTDKPEGYREDIVKSCLIEAVLQGVQPVGNQFNIIAKNCYITKEGFGYLLKNIKGLRYDMIPQLPRTKEGSSSGAVVMDINWSYKGTKDSKSIDFAVKINAYMGIDAIVGKATRKARKWLYEHITGNEVPDGEIEDIQGEVLSSKVNGGTNTQKTGELENKAEQIIANSAGDFEKQQQESKAPVKEAEKKTQIEQKKPEPTPPAANKTGQGNLGL